MIADEGSDTTLSRLTVATAADVSGREADVDYDVEKNVEKIATGPSRYLSREGEPARPITITDWSGSDDAENPWNWPFWEKAYHTSIPAFQSFAM
jgi:hypothetical protein